jgi:hypothetical protein
MWNKRLLWLSLALLPGLARADITAVYATPDGQKVMKVEIATNGNLRSETSPGARVIFLRDGTSYIVDRHFAPPMVARIDDLAAAIFELMAKAAPAALEQAKHAPHRVFVAKGTATVQGRSGDAYFVQAPDGTLSSAPVVVISRDPALAAIGRAVAAQFEQGEKLSPSGGNAAMRDILRSGAPLYLNGLELRSVSDAAVDPSRFELPAPVETPAAIREQLTNPSPAG